MTKFLNVQLVILGFWLEIRNKLITLKMPSSNTIAINFIRTEIQLKGCCSWGSMFMIIVKAHIVWGAPEGVWVQGGRIKLLCKYFVYGLKKFKAWGNSELHKRQETSTLVDHIAVLHRIILLWLKKGFLIMVIMCCLLWFV